MTAIFPPICKKDIAAFSLVEVSLAIGLLSFCLVAMLGLVPVGLRQEKMSTEKIQALEMLAAVAADFQAETNPADPTKPAPTPRFKIALPAVGVAVQKSSFLVDDRGEMVTDPEKAAYKVWYEITPASSRYGSYAIYLCVARAASALSEDTVDKITNQDFVESVTTRSVF